MIGSKSEDGLIGLHGIELMNKLTVHPRLRSFRIALVLCQHLILGSGRSRSRSRSRQTVDLFAAPIQSLARSATLKLNLDQARVSLACALLLTTVGARLAAADEPPNSDAPEAAPTAPAAEASPSVEPVATPPLAGEDASQQDEQDEQQSAEAAEDAAVTRRKLAPFLAAAETALKRFDSEIEGYTCLLIKRERIKDALSEHQYLWMKVREPRREGEQLTTPQSIYIRYLKPSHLAGREILYVENQLNGRVLARKGGRRLPNLTMPIRPDSTLAMAQSRQPISKAGIRSLLEDLVRSMRAELVDSDCVLNEYKSAKMSGRPCRHFEVRQQVRKPGLDYQLARVLLDEELRLPVYFASYAWADQPGDDPVLQEEYMFTRLKLNPKLTDHDFHRDNPEYKFSPEDDEEPQGDLKEQLEDPDASKDL